jgi:hypothetical protein
MNLWKLKVELLQVWPHDANDFTYWLAGTEENLLALSDEPGLDVTLVQPEGA